MPKKDKTDLVSAPEQKVERRGNHRGKGSRPDSGVQALPGDNRKYLQHNMKMMNWPDVDMKEPEQVKERIGMYFAVCEQDDMKPSVAGIALAFGVDRKTIWAWANGVDSAYIPAQSRNFLKKAYQLLNAQMENYMQNGKINPVAGIFLMNNNMGYQNRQDIVVTPNNPLGESSTPEDLQKRYLEATVCDYEEVD